MTTPRIEDVEKIVRQAAELMMAANFEITHKEGYANIVTSTDVAVQDFLCKHLAELLPGSGFLCEEDDIEEVDELTSRQVDKLNASETSNLSTRQLVNSSTETNNSSTNQYIWIIDPIDGTANFARGIDQCAICVGLMERTYHSSTIILSIIYIPRTGELFHAEKGKGAFLNGKQIHVSDRPFANGILCTALPVYHKEHAPLCSKIILEAFTQCNDIRRFGACAPELCYLAMGRCEMYFEYLLSPWDFAAASLILTEAGGVITGLNGQAPTCLHPSGIVAANNKENLEKMLGIARSM